MFNYRRIASRTFFSSADRLIEAIQLGGFGELSLHVAYG